MLGKDDRYGVAMILLVAALCLQPSDDGPLWPYVVTVGLLLATSIMLLRK